MLCLAQSASQYQKIIMKLDVAVLELLGLDAIKTQVSSAGGGGCSSASTYEITSELDNGSKAVYFMKTGTGNEAEVMFRGETQESYLQK